MDISEDEIQRAVFSNFKQRRAPGVFAFHPRNSGKDQRRMRRRGINAGLGVVSGVPDVVAVKRGQMYVLELKTEEGELRPSQEAALAELARCGAVCGVAYGLSDALAWCERHELLVGTAA